MTFSKPQRGRRAAREFAALALVDDVIWLKTDIPPPERQPPVMRLFD